MSKRFLFYLASNGVSCCITFKMETDLMLLILCITQTSNFLQGCFISTELHESISSHMHHVNPFLLFTVSYFGDSYCRIDVVQDLLSFHLSLQFKTSRRSGLLLLAAGNRDYLSLELVNGRLQVTHTHKPDPTILWHQPTIIS